LAIEPTQGTGCIRIRSAAIAAFAVHDLQDTVTATRNRAGIGATVGIDGITIITGFASAGVDVTVAAGFVGRAIAGAAVARLSVAVVANFGSIQNAVAATLALAVEPARCIWCIAIGQAVVANFTVYGLDNAVAATRYCARVGATIGIDGVTIVASFASHGINPTVATSFVG
jgi:hypothetical protein